jgi:hypothetical protein
MVRSVPHQIQLDNIRTRRAGPDPINHAASTSGSAGRLVFGHPVLNPGEAPEERLILYSGPPESDTPLKLSRLLDADTLTPAS